MPIDRVLVKVFCDEFLNVDFDIFELLLLMAPVFAELSLPIARVLVETFLELFINSAFDTFEFLLLTVPVFAVLPLPIAWVLVEMFIAAFADPLKVTIKNVAAINFPIIDTLELIEIKILVYSLMIWIKVPVM